MTRFQSRQGQVIESLGREILSGRYPTGSALILHELGDTFGVSRTVMREAFGVLMSKGLVEAKPRVGTYVALRSTWNLLDRDVIAWRLQVGLDLSFFLNLEELRRIFEPVNAGLAAEFATDDEIAEIRRAYDSMQIVSDDDSHGSFQTDFTFHQAISVATHNELLVVIINLLAPLFEARTELIATQLPKDHQFLEKHKRVMEAIEARDKNRARAAMEDLLARAEETTKKGLSEKKSKFASKGKYQTKSS